MLTEVEQRPSDGLVPTRYCRESLAPATRGGGACVILPCSQRTTLDWPNGCLEITHGVVDNSMTVTPTQQSIILFLKTAIVYGGGGETPGCSSHFYLIVQGPLRRSHYLKLPQLFRKSKLAQTRTHAWILTFSNSLQVYEPDST